MSITIEQFRAARALLGWSQQELAAKSHVSRNAIIKFENSMSTPLPRTLEDLVEAFEDAGVIFISEDDGAGVGVRLKKGVTPTPLKRVDRDEGAGTSDGGMKAAWDFEAEEDVDLDALLSEEPGLNPDMAEMWRDDPELWARLSQGGRETLSRRMYGDTRAVSEEYFRRGV
jgi:transcriptional regulator with XRE-family HTH domain